MTLSNDQERILGMDYGEKRIGIAITDPLKMFAYPLVTLKNDSYFWKNLLNIFQKFNVVKIVLGYPIREDGKKSKSTEMVERFKHRLESRVKIPVELIDERYSSETARQRIVESVVSKRKRRNKDLIDKNAAAVILEDYLDQIG